MDEHEQQPEQDHRGQKAHHHNDALKGQHLLIVAGDVLGQLQRAHDRRILARPQRLAAQGIEHAQHKSALAQRHPERSLPGRDAGNNLRLGSRAVQHVVQVGRGQARPAHILLLGGIGHQARKIIDAQPLHRQALDHGLYHPVQMLILGGLAQGDTPAGQNGGQGETPENLAVEIFHQQARKILLTGQQGFARRIGNEERKPQAGQQNDHQRQPGQGAGITQRQRAFRRRGLFPAFTGFRRDMV